MPEGPPLADLGRTFTAWIWGDDGMGVGRVAFGFISTGPEGVICTIRGTQTPDGSAIEWLDDLDAFLEDCPLVIGAKWHRGFGRVYSTLRVGVGGGREAFLQAFLAVQKAVIVCGHSLGGPLASFAALDGKASSLILFASPKPGDSYLRQAVFRSIEAQGGEIASYANPNDAVPKVPITVDFPFKVIDFQHIVEPTELSPSLVTPPIPSDWASSHSLQNYLSLLEALP
jgi:pimeloyl-ACP methyl ester carboxylesterase